MAGRPRTMARRVQRIWDRAAACHKELATLMPEWCIDPNGNEFGETWLHAVYSMAAPIEPLLHLIAMLKAQAKQAEQAVTSDDAEELDDDADDAVAEPEVRDTAVATPDAGDGQERPAEGAPEVPAS